MRALLLLTLMWLGAAARGDEQLVEQFDGHNSLTTSDFNVPDHWEIRWHSSQALSIGVIRLDNTVVAGASGMNNGSLYLPKGGTYRLRVKGEDPIPWDVTVVSLGPTPATSAPASPDSSSFYVPTPGPDYVPIPDSAPASEPTPALPPKITQASPPPPPAPVPTQLTEAQENALVRVKGDRTEGAGFFLKTPSGFVVITSLHLLSDNPRLVVTQGGTELKLLSLQGAADRDLAMISVEGGPYPGLEAATDIPNAVHTSDVVLTAGSATSRRTAQVLTIAVERIDFGNFQDHGESGGPLVLAKLGQVIAVVTAAPRIALSTDVDKTSFASRDAAVTNSTTYFGLRLDTVSTWENYDWKRFATETAFLDEFHQRSRCLDSYLNGKPNDYRPAAKLYLSDEKIKTANDNCVQDSAGGDNSQRLESLRSLLFELGIVADTDLDQIQQPSNFYSFDRQRARDEIAYRQALKAQLDYYSNNVNRFNSVARRNS